MLLKEQEARKEAERQHKELEKKMKAYEDEKKGFQEGRPYSSNSTPLRVFF